MQNISQQDIETGNRLLQMGAMLQKEKRFAEADPVFLKIYQQFPNDHAAIYAYGNNLYEMGKLEEAEKYVRQAIRMDAKSAAYWHTLICICSRKGDGRELRRLYKDGMARFPEYFPMVENRMILQIENWELKENIAAAERLLKSARLSEYEKKLVAAVRGLALYLKGDVAASRDALSTLDFNQEDFGSDFTSVRFQLKIYLIYLENLFAFRDGNKQFYDAEAGQEEIYVLGDSHVLSPSYAVFNGHRLVPKLTIGLKAWHLSEERQNRFKHSFEVVSATIPDGAPVVFSYGEIDCRLKGGIFAHHLKHPELDLDESINELVGDYIEYIDKRIKAKNLKAVVAGVPAPNLEYNLQYCRDEDVLKRYVEVTRKFNRALKERVERAGLAYADFYAASMGENGWAKPGCHIDQIHLMPDFYLGVISEMF